MMPACRMAPPKRCLNTQASSMNPRDPARTAPTGAPSPLVRSIQRESTWAAKRRAGVPVLTTAFISRAPSMWQARPNSRAAAQTASTSPMGQQAPPTMFAVCSMDTTRLRGM